MISNMRVESKFKLLKATLLVLSLFAITVGSVLMFATPRRVSADETAELDVELTIEPVISITASPTEVAMEVTPTAAGDFVSGDTTVTVSTNNSTGYTLKASSMSETTALVHNTTSSLTIPTLTGSVALADFCDQTTNNNRWGFTHDNTTLLASDTYLGVPPLSAPVTIKATTAAGLGSETVVTFGAKIDVNTREGTYENTVVFTATPNYVLLPALQDFTANTCTNLKTFDASKASHTTYTYRDSRDDKEYTVRKLADGNCWMTSNLRLAGGTEITAADSDITAASYTLPSEWQNSSYTAYMLDATDSANGAYYNWVAAAAGQNISTGATAVSICPKGWKLPARTMYEALYTLYGSDLSTFNTAFNTVLAGYALNGQTYDIGVRGDYWSADTENETRAFIMRITETTFSAASDNYISKNGGRPVRCYFVGE